MEILERSVRDCAGFEDQRAFNEDQLGLHAVAKATEGFSGADLRALATDAHMHAVHRAMESETPGDEEARLSRRLSRGRTWLGRRGRRGGRCRLGSASGSTPCLRSFVGVGWGPAGRRRRARVPSAYPWRETRLLERTEQVLKSPTHQSINLTLSSLIHSPIARSPAAWAEAKTTATETGAHRAAASAPARDPPTAARVSSDPSC